MTFKYKYNIHKAVSWLLFWLLFTSVVWNSPNKFIWSKILIVTCGFILHYRNKQAFWGAECGLVRVGEVWRVWFHGKLRTGNPICKHCNGNPMMIQLTCIPSWRNYNTNTCAYIHKKKVAQIKISFVTAILSFSIRHNGKDVKSLTFIIFSILLFHSLDGISWTT